MPGAVPRIRVLDPHVADQIAAGEVVERPASVLKELVENALDAGARRIVCEIREGGKREIVVRDDGCGMSPEEARLAILRHATSKIADMADLQSLATLGFRGEALPSVASVARMEIATREHGSAGGWRLQLDAGSIAVEGPAGVPEGTVVAVRDLFFNTPARAAGFKSAGSETAACVRALEPLMLSRPDVAMSLASDGQVLLRTQGSGRLEDALAAIHGPDFARSCLPLAFERGGVAVSGAVGLPALARGTRRFQTIVVNGHAVHSLAIRSAAEAACRTLLPERRFPAFVLILAVDPARVDVNVHPRKLEVRFSDERSVAGTVNRAIREAIAAADLTPDIAQLGGATEGPAARLREAGDRQGAGLAEPRDARGAGVSGSARPTDATHLAPSPGSSGAPPRSLWGAGARESAATADRVAEAMRLYMADEDGRFPPLQVLGAHADTFLVATGPDGVYLIDQHAAHERVQYERILARRSEAVSRQMLPSPIVLEMTPDRMATWEDWREVLEENGLLAEPFGPRQLAVRAVPAAFARRPEAALRDFVDRLFEEEWPGGRAADAAQGAGGIDALRAAFARAACRSSVRARERLQPAEWQALVAELRRLANPFTCPHGRPTMWKITTEQVERHFGRR